MKKMGYIAVVIALTGCATGSGNSVYIYRGEFRNPDTNEIVGCGTNQPSKDRLEIMRNICRKTNREKGFTEIVNEGITTMPKDEYYNMYVH